MGPKFCIENNFYLGTVPPFSINFISPLSTYAEVWRTVQYSFFNNYTLKYELSTLERTFALFRTQFILGLSQITIEGLQMKFWEGRELRLFSQKQRENVEKFFFWQWKPSICEGSTQESRTFIDGYTFFITPVFLNLLANSKEYNLLIKLFGFVFPVKILYDKCLFFE